MQFSSGFKGTVPGQGASVKVNTENMLKTCHKWLITRIWLVFLLIWDSVIHFSFE
jgi:hypothetical protein